MASHDPIDDADDDFGGDFSKNSGNKRGFGDLEKTKSKETYPGAETGTILHLRESLRICEDTLATCQAELETAKSDIHKWISSFQNKNFIPAGSSPESRHVINFLQSLESLEESIKLQLDKAKKMEAALIVMLAKRETEIAELKAAVRDLKLQLKPPSLESRRLLLDPAIHQEFTRLKIHELEPKLALQKSQNTQLRSQYEALHKHMEGLTNDVERSNALFIALREKLTARDSELRSLREKLAVKDSELRCSREKQPKSRVVEEKEKVDSPPNEK